MNCELVVPGLLFAGHAGRFPAIELLAARGRRSPGEPRGLERWLREEFGAGGEPLAAGALTVLAGGGEPGDAAWLRADPVHLQLMRDRVVVVPAEALDLPREEAGALVEALNAHFPEKIAFQLHDARRWTARVAENLPVADEPALAAAGREAAPSRASGPLLTEIQMLLHAHPVNAAREARGEQPVNSLWLWGAGRAAAASSRWISVLADEPLALGFARLARCRHVPLPAGAAAWLDRAPEEGRHLLVLDALRAPAALQDPAVHEEALRHLEAAWFAPLLDALRAGRIGMATVHVPEAGLAFETVRGDLRRFWRRPRALERLA
jgi:hypothetical protein